MRQAHKPVVRHNPQLSSPKVRFMKWIVDASVMYLLGLILGRMVC